MATQGEYLINQTVNDVNDIRTKLSQIHADIDQAYQRYLALTVDVLAGYAWPAGYTESDFTSLLAVLNALPDGVVTDSARNAIYKLVSTFQ